MHLLLKCLRLALLIDCLLRKLFSLFESLLQLLLLELELPVLIIQSTDVDLAIADGRHLAAKLFDFIAHVEVIFENSRHIAVDLELLLPAYLLLERILGDLL